MTEAEWLSATDPGPMLKFLRDTRGATRRKQGRRQLRLFACACVRGVWPLLRHPGSRQALYYAELYADAQTTELDLATSAQQARVAVVTEYPNSAVRSPAHGQAAQAAGHAAAKRYDDGNHPSVVHAAIAASRAWALDKGESIHGEGQQQRQAVHADWLRDIFGNPFRPVSLSPSWRTDTVLSLAAQVYESRDFSAMPILADALQDAGCEDEVILTHCRAPSPTRPLSLAESGERGEDWEPHVRGCWVVDGVLRKS